MLTKKQIEELKLFDTPTVSNAIERFKIRDNTKGFMSSKIKCILNYDVPLVGYACTAKISAINLPSDKQKKMLMEYYKQVKETPRTCITVIQDLDPIPIGSLWGEVNASIHKALGCKGVITNGGVRDLDEVRQLGFSFFASCVLVSHANVHIEDYSCPVELGGLQIKPNDLLHADKHGVCLIPEEIASEVAEACRKAQWSEKPVIEGCKNHFEKGDLKIDDLKAWREEMTKRRLS